MTNERTQQTIKNLPGHDGESGWVATLPARTATAKLVGSVSVDCAVVGAGFTGLAMARRIRELRPDATVTVVDAGSVGAGASGRTSGVVLDLNHRAALMPPAERDAYVSLSRVPLFTYGSFTRPLTQAEQDTLGGETEWGLFSTDPMGSSVRRTRDQRLLIRNTVSAGFKPQTTTRQRSAAQVHHRRAFRARFPQLSDIPFEHTWAGLMGVSNSAQPAIQELHPGIYTAAGYTATGIALGTSSGAAAVDLAFNQGSPELLAAESLKGPSWVPPEPFRTLGGTAVAKLMNRQAADYV